MSSSAPEGLPSFNLFANAAFAPQESFAREMDASDHLAAFRSRFHLPRMADGSEVVYFAGNSLGLMPVEAEGLVAEELAAWKSLAVEGHHAPPRPWKEYEQFFSLAMADIVGARPEEVVVMNALTVNLHFLMLSFYRPTRYRYKILIEKRAFPSDQYAFKSQLRLHGHDPADALVEVEPARGEASVETSDIEDALRRESRIALILLSGVHYLSGHFHNLEEITSLGHRHGCLVGLDLAHAAGNVPLSLHDWNVDFAAWCTYKYLNAGPGSVGAIFVHERHADRPDLPRLSGWWGHDRASRFLMPPDFLPLPGAEGWQVSNPPILSTAPLLASLKIFQEAGMRRLREKSIALTGYLEYLLREWLPDLKVVTPSDVEKRGCQLSLHISQDGLQLASRLGASGLKCDFRQPSILRLAPVPLYNSFLDVYRAATILRSTFARPQAEG